MKQEKVDKIRVSMDKQLQDKKKITIVDTFIDIGILDVRNYERWRKGQVAYLEKVCLESIPKLSKTINEIYKYANELKLKSSITYYKKYGGKKAKLIFSKSSLKYVEDRYSAVFYNN